MNKIMCVVAGMLVATSLAVSAEDNPAPKGDRPQRPEGQRHPPPLIAALDANQDRVIDATEIDNAPAALRKLDKNGDGKLTREELMPPRPPREGKGKEPRPGRPAEDKPAE